jgi:hypothetical protein
LDVSILYRKTEKLFDLALNQPETLLYCHNKKGFVKVFDILSMTLVKKIRFAYDSISIRLLPGAMLAVSTGKHFILWS